VSVCDGISSNTASATVSKAVNAAGGYIYTYSYAIKACGSTVGYNIRLEGAVPKVIDNGVAVKSREKTGSSQYQSAETYNKLCVVTSDSSIGNYCVNIA
jgi:hypothetical protein